MTKDEEVDAAVGVGGVGGRGGGGGGRGGAAGAGGRGATPPDIRNWSPDSTAFVFARNHNLFVVEKAKNDTIQVTTRASEISLCGRRTWWCRRAAGYDAGGDSSRRKRRRLRAANRPSRANVTWSPDSRAFTSRAPTIAA